MKTNALFLCAAVVLLPIQAVAQTAQPMAVPIGNPSGVGGGGGGGGPVPAPTIMVVDADMIMQRAKASQSIQSQLEAQQQSYQKEFSAKQTELENEQGDLAREQRTVSADQFEEKRHAFAKKMEDVQREVDVKKRGLAQGAGEAIDKVKRALVEVVSGIAQERRSNLVLLRSQVILYDPAYDASEEALKRLDQKLTSVQVVIGNGATASNSAGAPRKP